MITQCSQLSSPIHQNTLTSAIEVCVCVCSVIITDPDDLSTGGGGAEGGTYVFLPIIENVVVEKPLPGVVISLGLLSAG